MNHFLLLPPTLRPTLHSLLRPKSCRTSRTPLWLRREFAGKSLDAQWREFRSHATIENDANKMLRLAADIERRRLDAARSCIGH